VKFFSPIYADVANRTLNLTIFFFRARIC